MKAAPNSRLSSMIVLIGLVGSMSGLLIGYCTAVIAPALELIARDFGLGTFLQGVAVSAVLLGGFVGALLAGGFIRSLGERPTLFVTALLFIVGSIGSGLSVSFMPWLVWRSITGLAVGAATMVGPLYVSETAPAHMRGALVSTVQLTITIGILASYLAGALWTAGGDWPSMLLVGAVSGVVMLLVVAAVPESPCWYLLKGRVADAERAHRRLTGGGGDPLPAQLAVAIDGNWRNLLVGRNFMVLVLATGLFVFANLSGIDAILYYAPTIFAEVGFGGTYGPILATVGIGTINVLATIVAMALIDRLGRRPLLIWGLISMVASLLILAAALLAGRGADWSNIAAVTCLSLFVLAFGVSLGPLPYVLMSELFPLALRGPGMGIASAAAWGVNVVVSLTFPLLVAAFGIAWCSASTARLASPRCCSSWRSCPRRAAARWSSSRPIWPLAVQCAISACRLPAIPPEVDEHGRFAGLCLSGRHQRRQRPDTKLFGFSVLVSALRQGRYR